MRIFLIIPVLLTGLIIIFPRDFISDAPAYKYFYQVHGNNTLIKDRQSLIKYAEPILFQTYGKENILKEKPYKISFKNGVWSMDGTLPKQYTVGGTFHIVINARDGKVVKMIHYK